MALGTQDVAGQTGDNIVVGGATYTIATDWDSGGGTGFSAAHVQIVKPAWGDTDNSWRVSTEHPLPVQLLDSGTGYTAALIADSGALNITGGVRLGGDVGINSLPINLRDAGTSDGAVAATRAITSILQVVGPTYGVCGPTGYSSLGHAVTDDYFMPIKVTGAVKGQKADGYFGVTFDKADTRVLYGGPIGWVGYGGTYAGYTIGQVDQTGLSGAEAHLGDEPYPIKDIDFMMIQGISGGTPVGITAQSSVGLLTRRLESRNTRTPVPADVKDYIAVEGFAGMTALSVTGGVVIHSQPHGGSFEVRDLVYSRDSVAIASVDGSTAAQFKLLGPDGSAVGVSAGALKVAVDNGAFSITANVGAEVEVKGSTGSSGLQVRGITHQEVAVRGMLSGGAIEVASPSGLNTRALTDNDIVGIGGPAGSRLTEIATNTNSSLSELTSIKSTIQNQRLHVADISERIRTFESGNTASIQTSVQEIKQPSELISITKSVTNIASSIAVGIPVYNGVNIQADPYNQNDILVGDATLSSGDTGYLLQAGESIFLQIDNLGKVFVKSGAGLGGAGGGSTSKVRVIGS